MKLIKLNNIKNILSTHKAIELEIDKNESSDDLIVVLSEDDINDNQTVNNLKGYTITALIIPKRFKYTFNDTEVGKILIQQLDGKIGMISHY